MDKKKVLDYLKTHKKEIAIAGVTTVGGALLLMVGCKKIKPRTMDDLLELKSDWMHTPCDAAKDVGWTLGTLTDYWHEDGFPTAIVNDVKLSDLGALGEEFLKFEEVDKDKIVSLVVGLNCGE